MKINPKAILLREVTTKVVQILASKKIKVTQRGTKAYVQYDEKTFEPILVNIPYIPDDANDELLDAIQGFIDHELGHIFFTDPKAIVAANKKGIGSLHNAIEDTYIERKQRENYRGSGSNLENTAKFFLKNFTDKKLKEDPKNKIAYLMIPAIRAWAGQLIFKEYMDKGDKWNDIKEITARLGKLVDELPKINSSWEALDLAERMTKVLKASEKPKESKPKEKPKAPPKEEKFEEPPEETGDGSTGEGSGDGEAGKGSSGKGEKSEKEKEVEKEDDKSAGAESEKDDEKFESDESDEVFSGRSEVDDDEEGSAESGEMGEGVVASDEDADETFYGDEDADGDASAAKTTEVGGGDAETEMEPTGGSLIDKLDGMGDYDEALEKGLSSEMSALAKESDYFIWTKDFDVIEIYQPTADIHSLDRRVEAMQTKSDAMVGVMQKDLERAIAARSLAVWRSGLRRGRINASSLSRLATGDDRVFRRRDVAISKDVAISLLVDNSGSMTGNRIQTASDAAFAMSSVLDRMNIANEVLGFSAHYSKMPERELAKAAHESGVTFARTLPLYIPIYKAFDERLTPETKRRIAGMALDRNILQENVDGESLQIAAGRLLKRKEKRHILMVFSDGQPACPGNYHQLRAHLKNSVKLIEQSGVDVIGVGIQTNAVQQYYSKHVVLNEVEQLAGEVMQQLRKFLLN